MKGTNRTLWGDKKGISPIAGFAIILVILTTTYTFYQVFVVPSVMESYEAKQFYSVVNELLLLQGEVDKLILHGSPTAFALKLGGDYPQILFFATPQGFSGTLTSYPAEIRISNAIALDPDIRDVWDGSEMVFRGTALLYSPSTFFSQQGDVRIEYGVVAVGRSAYFPVGGSSIIDGNRIFLQMFTGNVSESGSVAKLELYPYSGGGDGIGITNAPGSSIKISLKTSLPLSFWQKYFEGAAYVTNVTRNGDYVVVTLMQGINYTLTGGAADIEGRSRASPHYLYRLSPPAATTPANLRVEVRDTFNNPVPGVSVTFTSMNSSTTLTDGSSSGTSITVTSNELGEASVVAKSSAGRDVVVASITRPDGSTYEVTFTIVG